MATTIPFDATNAYVLYLMDGTVGTAGKIDNAEGTAARDLVEVGTLTAGTGQTTPTSDGTYNGFGTTAYMSVDQTNLLTWPTGAQTWEAWVNFASLPGDASFVFSKNGASAGPYFAVLSDGTLGGRIANAVGGSFDFGFTGTALSTSTWQYIAMVYVPSTSVTLYLDGNQVSQTTSSVPASTLGNAISLGVGTQISSTANFVTGQIDALKVSTVSLTATDILNYYNGPAAAATKRHLTLLGVS